MVGKCICFMVFPALVILFALFAVKATRSDEEECTLPRLQGCLESLQSMAQGSDLALVTSKEKLMTVCETLASSVVCVDDHMRNCFTSTQRKVFNHVVSGARQFLKELCIPGEMQDTYLRHSPCYRNVSLSEDKCATQHRRLIQLSEHVDERRDIDEGLKLSCCAFNAFVQCKHFHTEKDCGQEASHFLHQYLDNISNPLIREHCEHYMHAQDACVLSASTNHVHPSHQMTAFFFIIICILLLWQKTL